MFQMNRREFLGMATGVGVFAARAASSPEIVDTHTHFYDPSRPQGVPWPAKSDEILYRTVLPDEFSRMTRPLGVRGTIVIEASALLEDNDWILNLAAKHPSILGFVGHLVPGKPDFGKSLERLRKNRLFLGIRLSSSSIQIPDANFMADLKSLADAGLELDVIGGTPVLQQTLRLTDRFPGLRIVIDHLPFELTAGEATQQSYKNALRDLRDRPRVYAKVSNVVRRVGNVVSEDVNDYRPAIDELWDVFGPDRLVYGSNWPVSDHVAPYATLLKVVQAYFAGKGSEASAKFFWQNSKAAYRFT